MSRSLNPSVRRVQIIEAGARAFVTRGYGAATVADILTEAEIARRTFYAHFKSKEEVLLAAIDELLARLRLHFDERRRQARPTTSATLKDDIRRSLLAWFQFFAKHRALSAAVLIEASGHEDAFRERWSTLRHEICAHLRQNVVTLQAAGHFRKALSPDALIIFFYGLLYESVCGYVLVKKNPDLEWLADQLVEFELQGVQATSV